MKNLLTLELQVLFMSQTKAMTNEELAEEIRESVEAALNGESASEEQDRRGFQ